MQQGRHSPAAESSLRLPPLDWTLLQRIRGPNTDDIVQEGEFITSVEFNKDGSFFAVGDRAGRVSIYERDQAGAGATATYSMYASFQSHEPEFDYLKSLDIEEKINMMKWCPSNSSAQFLITTNDKTIKLWKVHRRRVLRISNLNADDDSFASSSSTSSSLRLPTLVNCDSTTTASCKRVFGNAHAYHINSVSLSSDQETFLSSDDLRVNLWSLDVPDQSFNVVDIKPDNMEELTEVITASECHPISCNLFMYSSSRGAIRLMDLRQKALCEQPSQVYEVEEDPADRSFFSEIISSISDVKFTKNGRYIVSRDCMTMRIWDMTMTSQPVETVQIHEFLNPCLSDLYENDCIFDKFEIAASHDGTKIVTGSYDFNFLVYDRTRQATQFLHTPSLVSFSPDLGVVQEAVPEIPEDPAAFLRKSLHVTWHPSDDIFALTCGGDVCLYCTPVATDSL